MCPLMKSHGPICAAFTVIEVRFSEVFVLGYSISITTDKIVNHFEDRLTFLSVVHRVYLRGWFNFIKGEITTGGNVMPQCLLIAKASDDRFLKKLFFLLVVLE